MFWTKMVRKQLASFGALLPTAFPGQWVADNHNFKDENSSNMGPSVSKRLHGHSVRKLTP